MSRKEREFNYIYKITCNVTNKYYIGMHATSNLEDGYFGSGKRIRYSVAKHGKNQHTKEILEFLDNRQQLRDRERELVNEASLLDPLCMNLQIGGEGGFCSTAHQLKCASAGGRTNTPIKREKAIARMKESNHKMQEIGKFKSIQENCNWNGRHHSVETKDKIREKNSIKQGGTHNSQFGTKWMTHPVHGSIKVKAEECTNYENLGYLPGRKLLFSKI
jgi:hypothetical protein